MTIFVLLNYIQDVAGGVGMMSTVSSASTVITVFQVAILEMYCLVGWLLSGVASDSVVLKLIANPFWSVLLFLPLKTSIVDC